MEAYILRKDISYQRGGRKANKRIRGRGGVREKERAREKVIVI